VDDAARVVMPAVRMPNGRNVPKKFREKNRGRIVRPHGDALSRGRIVQGTVRPGDGSSRGQIVQGTDRPGDGSSRGWIVQGTFRPGTHRPGTDRAGTDRQGTSFVYKLMSYVFLKAIPA
jgi:hypothetical protein